MPTLPTHLRSEKKFVPDGRPLPEVLGLVRRHPALFRQAFPPRIVNNLYLDSPELRDYRDHVGGMARRAKTRVRWYGPVTGPVSKPTLERKIKLGSVGGKIAYPLPALAFDNGANPRRLVEEALSRIELPELVRQSLRCVQPVLINRYLRHYFESADRTCRLTVDSELEFYSADIALTAQRPLAPREPRIVIELKYDPDRYEPAAAIANALPFRLRRCSKYVLGVDTLRGVALL